MGKYKSPLTRKQYDDLKRAERVLLDQIEVIDRMDSCGMECDNFRSLLAQLQTEISTFEKAFYNPIPK